MGGDMHAVTATAAYASDMAVYGSPKTDAVRWALNLRAQGSVSVETLSAAGQ